MWQRHVCYVCKRSVCGGDEPQPVAHLSHKLQCARQSLKIMVSYGNKYPRHNARPHVVEQSGQCARALIIWLPLPVLLMWVLSWTALRGLWWASPPPCSPPSGSPSPFAPQPQVREREMTGSFFFLLLTFFFIFFLLKAVPSTIVGTNLWKV